MARTFRRFYKHVAANSSEVDEFTPPAGNYFISLVGGNAGVSPATVVAIHWDYGEAGQEMLFSTHGDAKQDVQIELDADGTKKLAIVLQNDQGTADCLGGFWTGSS